MKKISLFCLSLLTIGLTSCKNNEDKKELLKKAAEEAITSTSCFQAIYDHDTLDLKLNTLKNGKINGDMVMNIANHQKKIGEIAGEYRGDTLFASYTFTLEKKPEITFKNPMAFLKRNDTLVLGNGKIETSMGASYFAKGSPIDFDRVKYKFTAINCPDSTLTTKPNN
ncbi:hypothetical protein [Flavobacterium sp. UMI-01]|uniref:hypothetical protein n=1 Tax=Flavobacterium sp. UMI-01 TaxID=1441053 RepID=UPI001C7D4051|nr:hypothetical protein [Flavobacterium sp. UMI-01]GIZ09816.1 hypothetical protein FUMI01_25430 [Flavobacterium sp. UMI-01]